MRWPLTHYDGDIFWFAPIGENAFAASGVIFTVEPNRVASTVRMEYFDDFGQGTLTRVDRAYRLRGRLDRACRAVRCEGITVLGIDRFLPFSRMGFLHILILRGQGMTRSRRQPRIWV